jgi:hypothetical protein
VIDKYTLSVMITGNNHPFNPFFGQTYNGSFDVDPSTGDVTTSAPTCSIPVRRFRGPTWGTLRFSVVEI